jgi:hypothetical protein
MMSLIFFNSVDSNTMRKYNGCIYLLVEIFFMLRKWRNVAMVASAASRVTTTLMSTV